MNFKIPLQKSLQFLASYWDACDSNASAPQGSPLSVCHDFVRMYNSPQCSHDKLAQRLHAEETSCTSTGASQIIGILLTYDTF